MRRMGMLAVGIASATTGIAMIAACEDSGSTGGGIDSATTPFDSSIPTTDSAVPIVDSSVPLDSPSGCSVLNNAGFDASGIDASALVCPIGEWRDFAASTCKACPSTAVTCAALVRDVDAGGLPGSPLWARTNGGTEQTIETTLAQGTAQIVYATATAVVGSCFTAGANGANTIDIPVAINGNTLVSTFPNNPVDGGGSVTPCGTLTYTLVDACCATKVVSVRLVTDQESQSSVIARTCTDGG